MGGSIICRLAQDTVAHHATRNREFLHPASFFVVPFIDTNDAGINHFVTKNQRADVSLSGGTDCQLLDAIRSLRSLGACNFIMDFLVPFQFMGLYGGSSTPVVCYYSSPSCNGNAWNLEMTNLVHSPKCV